MTVDNVRSGYDAMMARRESFVERQRNGKVVVWPDERKWDLSRQGKIRWLLNPGVDSDTCLQDWYAFVAEIPRATGKHRHQGGAINFPLHGRGTTIIDGEAYDWEPGDLIILPIRDGGVIHQHLSREEPASSAWWLAYANDDVWDAVGGDLEQHEDSPLWIGNKGPGGEA